MLCEYKNPKQTPFQQHGGSSVVVFALRVRPPQVSTVLAPGGTLFLCETAKLSCGLKDVTTASIGTVLSRKQVKFESFGELSLYHRTQDCPDGARWART